MRALITLCATALVAAGYFPADMDYASPAQPDLMLAQLLDVPADPVIEPTPAPVPIPDPAPVVTGPARYGPLEFDHWETEQVPVTRRRPVYRRPVTTYETRQEEYQCVEMVPQTVTRVRNVQVPRTSYEIVDGPVCSDCVPAVPVQPASLRWPHVLPRLRTVDPCQTYQTCPGGVCPPVTTSAYYMPQTTPVVYTATGVDYTAPVARSGVNLGDGWHQAETPLMNVMAPDESIDFAVDMPEGRLRRAARRIKRAMVRSERAERRLDRTDTYDVDLR